jgi:predicted nuclease of predicted toxin-antitoxin system
MKFKIDENLPVKVAILLQKEGHEAKTVQQQQLSGAPDTDIAKVCQQEKRVLLTLDTDFGDIRAYPPEDFFGLIVLRLERQDKQHVSAVLSRITNLFLEEPLEGHLWIVEENRVRIRGKDH